MAIIGTCYNCKKDVEIVLWICSKDRCYCKDCAPEAERDHLRRILDDGYIPQRPYMYHGRLVEDDE